MYASARTGFRLSSTVGLAIAVSLVSGGLQAQQARELEEIILTAQKRAENLQDVPVAVTAIAPTDWKR